MKITDRGFSVTDLGIPGIKGIDVSTDGAGSKSIAIVAEPGQISHMFGEQEWRAFTDAVAAVNERLDGKPANTAARSVIVDGDGDEWTPVPHIALYDHSGEQRTRAQIMRAYGIRVG